MSIVKLIGEVIASLMAILFPTYEAVEAEFPGQDLVGARCGRYYGN